jgi:general secretion pathway protein E
VSTSPVTYGESIVLRLLGQARVPLDIDGLGIPKTGLSDLRHALARPHGIVLVTGPTGSGKTTTLYSALTHLRRPDVKILSVEDPVEIVLEGINQVQVQPEIDLDYARTLRAFLRQDPDILMVGEIRDQETAEISLRAALTGHLVLSTLHTNSALGAFTRLNDIGIEPFLAASTVIACVAQRLVRTLCTDCSITDALNPSQKMMFEEFGVDAPTSTGVAKGCKKCSGTGYNGRAPLFEIIMVDQPLRDLIRTGKAENYVTDKRETLAGHGLYLVAAGLTSFDEIIRVVQLDD